MSESVTSMSDLSEMEQTIANEISIDEPWALLEAFSTLDRLSGTEDERSAATYLTDRLTELGVSHERYNPELYISQPHDATIRTLNRTFEPGPVKTVSFSESTTVSGSVEYIGSIGSDLTFGPSDVEDESMLEDIEGKIALTTAGSLSIRASSILEDAGAIGVIAIHEHRREPHNGIATPVWGGAPTLEERDKIPGIPIVNVTNPDGETLREWADHEKGLELEISTDLTTDWFECPVVVADIEAGNSETDDFVLLHGHYDSWYVGITDNATGDAGMLELARVFEEHANQLERNLRVAWWPAHSTGRYAGSTWYADEFALDLAENCVAQVNMDSPGAKDSENYTDMSCWTPEAHGIIAESIDDVTGAPYEEQFPFRAGDYSFDNLGITGMFMLSSNIPIEEREQRGYHEVGGCGGNSDAWHVSTDTLDKAGEDELLRDITLYGVSILRVLNADILPFDHQRNVRHQQQALEDYSEAAGDAFDFTSGLDAYDELESALGQFYDAAETGDIDPAVANQTITDLSRILTRLYLVKRGQFEQDPAVGRQPLQRFAAAEQFEDLTDDDERRFLRLQLQREQNQLRHDLQDAQRLVSSALKES